MQSISGSSGSALSKSGSFGVLARGSVSVGGPGNMRESATTRAVVYVPSASAARMAAVGRMRVSSWVSGRPGELPHLPVAAAHLVGKRDAAGRIARGGAGVHIGEERELGARGERNEERQADGDSERATAHLTGPPRRAEARAIQTHPSGPRGRRRIVATERQGRFRRRAMGDQSAMAGVLRADMRERPDGYRRGVPPVR